MPDFQHNLRVYYEDTDEGGVVYHANYLKYAERARTEFLSAHGLSNKILFGEDGVRLVVRSQQIDYHKPAILEDSLSVTARVIKLSGASMVMEQKIFKGAELLIEMIVRIATIDKRGRACKMPQRLKTILEETND